MISWSCFLIHECIPFTSIAYSPKITNLLEENGLGDCYVKYGIRSTYQFYEKIDLDSTEFNKKILSAIDDEALRERISGASLKCKKSAKDAYNLLFAAIDKAMEE